MARIEDADLHGFARIFHVLFFHMSEANSPLEGWLKAGVVNCNL
jgi:hypothetical protein